jgi:hypothetical protein
MLVHDDLQQILAESAWKELPMTDGTSECLVLDDDSTA